MSAVADSNFQYYASLYSLLYTAYLSDLCNTNVADVHPSDTHLEISEDLLERCTSLQSKMFVDNQFFMCTQQMHKVKASSWWLYSSHCYPVAHCCTLLPFVTHLFAVQLSKCTTFFAACAAKFTDTLLHDVTHGASSGQSPQLCP